jgi:predicted phosphodiesterase
MKLQVFSDLHLEFGNLPAKQTDVDVIVAAGDVGVGMQGIEWLKRFEKPVIYVLGNHEYWGQDYSEFIDDVWQASSGTNVHFLENESVIIDDVRFLGCSLWTDYGNENDLIMDGAYYGMNDFRYIDDGEEKLQPRRLLETHQHSVDWLKRMLSEPYDGKTVIVTHHAPSFRSWHRDPGDGYRFCYCTDLEYLMNEYPMKLWVHGHTHNHMDYQVNGVRVYCNPRGYFKYEEVDGFQYDRIIDV